MIERIAQHAPAPLPADLWTEVLAAWSSPGRHYHTVHHLAEVAQHFATVPRWSDPGAVFLAVLAHDAIYDPSKLDNEARSAELARAWSRRTGDDGERAAALVLATAAHGGPAADTRDLDLLHFLDCDLAILGAAPARYDEYERQIAAEYLPVVPADVFRAGRARFLDRMLAGPVFHTELFAERFEAPARENLRRAVLALAQDRSPEHED